MQPTPWGDAPVSLPALRLLLEYGDALASRLASDKAAHTDRVLWTSMAQGFREQVPHMVVPPGGFPEA